MGAMNTKLADLEGSGAWESGISEPRVMFCLDDGHTISFWAHHIGKADASGDALTIEVAKGKVEIVGPKVKDLHRDFCRGKATHIKADGLDILSVRMVVP
jgi:hypothetical protein